MYENFGAVRGLERESKRGLIKLKRPNEELHDCAFYCILILKPK
jgi:hypothetical protein